MARGAPAETPCDALLRRPSQLLLRALAGRRGRADVFPCLQALLRVKPRVLALAPGAEVHARALAPLGGRATCGADRAHAELAVAEPEEAPGDTEFPRTALSIPLPVVELNEADVLPGP